MQINVADRLKKLPPYLFIEIDKMKRKAKDEGMDIIDLGIGDPDLPTLKPVIEEMQKEIWDAKNHQYPLGSGLKEFRVAVTEWYKKRFGVDFDPDTEAMALIGSKEAIGHLPLAFVNPGDVVLIPDPGYPVYNAGTIFAEGVPYIMPLLEKNGFLPDLDSIPADVLKKARLMFINYPNNPTAAFAPKSFFEKVVAFAKKNNIIVCHDAAYSEMDYDGEKSPSFFNVEGAKDIGIEMFSFSKTFNMTGWRLGYAVGHKDLIAGLASIKGNLDSGQFHAIQRAGIAALKLPEKWTDDLRKTYEKRRDVLVGGLKSLGWSVNNPKATFYVWIKVPEAFASKNKDAKSVSGELVKFLLQNCGIVSTPGVGFGKYGEGYIRMTICTTEERLKEAVKRMKEKCRF